MLIYQIQLFKVGAHHRSYEFIGDFATEEDAFIYAGRYCAMMNARLADKDTYCIMIRKIEGKKVNPIVRKNGKK